MTAGDILTSVNGKNLQHLPFAEVCRRMDEAKQDAIGGDLKLVLRACHMSLNTSPRVCVCCLAACMFCGNH